MGAFSPWTRLAGVTDKDADRAGNVAKKYGLKRFASLEDMLECADVDVILNTTPPAFHYGVALVALKAGKHVYNEKPICLDPKEADGLLELAVSKGLRIGCAPDTFLGAGIQTCVKLVDDGWIGRPVAATAFMAGRGPENWHPYPEFFYKPGGGPMYDMGPYYLSALVSLMGPVVRVSGSAGRGLATRTITSEPLRGRVMDVEVPTHIAGTLDFESGAVGTLVTSFGVCAHNLPFMEIYGTEGTLSVPDPNTFGGPVSVRRLGEDEWHKMPLVSGFTENSRGLGLAEMVSSIEEGRAHLASGVLARHALEAMRGIYEASESGAYHTMKSRCEKPGRLPAGMAVAAG